MDAQGRIDWNSIQFNLIYGQDYVVLESLRELNEGIRKVDNVLELLEFSRLDVWISRYVVYGTGVVEEEQRVECFSIIRTLLSRGVMTDMLLQVLLSIVECPGDSCWTNALELICEWTTLAPKEKLIERVWKALIEAVFIACEPILTVISYVILNALDNPDVRDRVPMNMIFATLLELGGLSKSSKIKYPNDGTSYKPNQRLEYEKPFDSEPNATYYLRAISFCIRLMEHFEGLIYLYSLEMGTMKFAMESLLMHCTSVKVSVLEMLIQLLDPRKRELQHFLKDPTTSSLGPICLLNSYKALLLSYLIDIGLLEIGMILLDDTNVPTASQAKSLLQMMHVMMNSLLPDVFVEGNLPFRSRSSVDLNLLLKEYPLMKTTQIPFWTRHLTPAHHSGFLNTTRSPNFYDFKLKIIEQGYQRALITLSRADFMNYIKGTNVLSLGLNEALDQWNWTLIAQVINFSCRTPGCFANATSSKFLKRFLDFYRPSKKLFSNLSLKKEHVFILKLPYLLFPILVEDAHTMNLLERSGVISELVQEINGLYHNQMSKPNASRKEFVSSNYLALIGSLTTTIPGLAFLNNSGFFAAVFRLLEFPAPKDVLMALLNNLDISLECDSRIFVSLLLKSDIDSDVKIHSFNILHNRLHLNEKATTKWIIQLLVESLYGTDGLVLDRLVSILECIVEVDENLEIFIGCKPIMTELRSHHRSKLLRYIVSEKMERFSRRSYVCPRIFSSPKGLSWLCEIHYAQYELEAWFEFELEHYVDRVENGLHNFQALPQFESNGDPNTSLCLDQYDGSKWLPSHLYGELCKTEEGYRLMRDKEHAVKMLHQIRQSIGVHDLSESELSRLKAYIWALCWICVSEKGAHSLLTDHENALTLLLQLGDFSRYLSIKAHCYLAMQLVTRSKPGREFLIRANWRIGSAGHCLPDRSLSLFFAAFSLVPFIETSQNPANLTWPKSDLLFYEILSKIYGLANGVIAQSSSKSLLRLREDHPHYFKRTTIYESIIGSLANPQYSFPLASIRFIHSLFSFTSDPSKASSQS